MELVTLEDFLKILNHVKNTEPQTSGNEKSKDYIDIEKAKNIIKLVMKNERLNQFLISGFLEKYVEYVYRNRKEIKKITNMENEKKAQIDSMQDSDRQELVTGGNSWAENSDIPDGDFCIEMEWQDFQRIISGIVIDDMHLSDDEIKDGCETYEMLKTNKRLNNEICYRYIKEYITFVYYNRYQIRKLASKDLPKIKRDKDGNYILRDEDFVGKMNVNGGHNSPLWICIDVSEGNDETEEVENTNKNLKKIIEDTIKFFRNFTESFTENRTEKKEEKVVRKQIEASKDEYEDVVKVGEIKNDIVVKNLLNENERETALIAEEVARQLGLPVAQYYPARYIGKMYTRETAEERQRIEENGSEKDLVYMTDKIVLTPNFLEQGEELITGDRIAKYEMDVSVVPNLIREFFRKEGIAEDKIDSLVSDYRVVMAYNCLINHRDCHNGNWGYIKNDKGEYRISHIFDLEGSLDENSNYIRAIFIGDHYTSDGNNIDEYILTELLKDKKCREKVENSFLGVNMKKVVRSVNLSKGVTISRKKENEVTKVIANEKKIFMNVLNELKKQDKYDEMENDIITSFLKDERDSEDVYFKDGEALIR